MTRAASTVFLLPLPATKEWGEGKSLRQLKLKTPNRKHQRSSKLEARAAVWSLEFGISFELGISTALWRRSKAPSPLRSAGAVQNPAALLRFMVTFYLLASQLPPALFAALRATTTCSSGPALVSFRSSSCTSPWEN